MSASVQRTGGRRGWIAALAAIACSATPAARAPGPETGPIAFSRAGDVWRADADGTDAVRLTSGGAAHPGPRGSPEGNRVAVVRDGDLVLLRPDGTLLRVLTTHGDVAGAPSWSSDGRHLAYVRATGGIAVVDSTLAGSDGILLDVGSVVTVAWNPTIPDQIAYTDGGAVYTVRPDGSAAGTEIIPRDLEGRFREELAWDPQLGPLVFTSVGPDGTRIEGAGVTLDGAFGDDRSPAWSADGQRLLFTRGGTLHVYQRGTFLPSTVRSLGVTVDSADLQPVLVAPAAAYETSGGTQLSFRVRAVENTPTLVTWQTVAGAGSASEGSDYVAAAGTVTTPDAFGSPAVVPVFVAGDAEPEQDETFFVDFTFPSDPAAPLRVRGTILNDDGGRNGVITYAGTQGVFVLDPVHGGADLRLPGAGSAAFSPDGSRLAFVRYTDTGSIELVVADPDGVPQAVFPLSGPIDHELAWSTDGARLAWTTGGELFVADPANPSSARSVAGDAVTPSWSSDPGPGPRRLAFARVSTGSVCTVRDDGSGEACLTPGQRPQWSPDNTTIAFLRADVSVFLMNADGGNVRMAASAPAAIDGAQRLRWSPRGGSFAFTTGNALLIGREGSAATPVAGLPATLWDFDWSPDGNQLVVQGAAPTGGFQLWVVGPDDAGTAFASTRQVTAEATGSAVEPRWSGAAPRPAATLASRGGTEKFRQARAQVELDAPSPDPVTVDWETLDTGSAMPGVDFTPAAGTVTLPPGETTAAIVVALFDDALAEAPESFDVRLTAASGARLGTASQVPVFITDDDNAPVAVDDVAVTAAGTPVDVAVLANDHDPDGGPLTLIAVGVPGDLFAAGGVRGRRSLPLHDHRR
jgi:Tol biopolymer transport system component